MVNTFQDTKSAAEFYEAKIKELNSNIQGLEGIVQAKTNNLRVVEEGQFLCYYDLSFNTTSR